MCVSEREKERKECMREIHCMSAFVCVCFSMRACVCICVSVCVSYTYDHIHIIIPKQTNIILTHAHANTADMEWQPLRFVGSLKIGGLFQVSKGTYKNRAFLYARPCIMGMKWQR
mmetsp:Transcript_98494/g.158819  ORF Transcript_98494/g.158819 Transcript_98494/m.158819 type:complete len:115 (+) Transcript_98494:81-425(+)